MLYYEDLELNVVRQSADYVVDRDELIDFARRWDPQPYHTSEQAAQAWGLELSGSSTHSYAILTKLQTEMPGDQPAVVAGLGIEGWRTPNPLRPGATVHAESFIDAKRASSSKPHLGLIESVSRLIDERGQVVLEYRSTGLVMRRPTGKRESTQ